MRVIRLTILLAALSALAGCADADRPLSSMYAPTDEFRFDPNDNHNYEAAHPDGPYVAPDPFSPGYDSLGKVAQPKAGQ